MRRQGAKPDRERESSAVNRPWSCIFFGASELEFSNPGWCKMVLKTVLVEVALHMNLSDQHADKIIFRRVISLKAQRSSRASRLHSAMESSPMSPQDPWGIMAGTKKPRPLINRNLISLSRHFYTEPVATMMAIPPCMVMNNNSYPHARIQE